VWIDGVTNAPGKTDGLTAQLGYGPDGGDPASSSAWTWVDAAFNTDAGNNDEFKASLLPEVPGSYDYAYRYSTTNGREWAYADLDGIGNGYSVGQAGALNVTASSDTTAPAVPQNARKVSASPAGVEVAWDAVTGDDTLYAYEVLRSSTAGGPYAKVGSVLSGTAVSGTASYNDTAVTEGATYHYVVRAVDASFNRSGDSNEVSAQALLRTMTLTFNVTVPAGTPADKSVYIAGFIDRLDGNNPQWNPGGVVLTKVDATTWRITFAGKETTQIEYKYALGSWDFVEKDGACGEIPNRTLTLSYGATGVQTVNDVVPNWRNVSPCGN
ncbi:MAG: alpha-amylase, partial [Anaerolineae bacterium]|nr:alpha-amylase [Anaerolineae bacterium]